MIGPAHTLPLEEIQRLLRNDATRLWREANGE